MRFLIVGAGAVGGYFGGRLVEAGKDVTFLVRAKRKEQLQETGLIIESAYGNAKLNPQLIQKGEPGQFDVVLFGTKAYHLENAIQDVKPFMHDKTVLIPLLNGIQHLEELSKHISPQQILGGVSFIESTLTKEGTILHKSKGHRILFGELDHSSSARVKEIATALQDVNASMYKSENIRQDMWRKYLFITMLSGITTLFQSSVGPIQKSTEGLAFTRRLIHEITAIMRHSEAPITDDFAEKAWQQFMKLNDELKASMQRDIEKGLPIEADHLQGYLLKLAEEANVEAPYLEAVYANLKVYEEK